MGKAWTQSFFFFSESERSLSSYERKCNDVPERKTSTTSMTPGVQITPRLQLATRIARSHGAADSPSRTSILADRVNSVTIVKGSNALGLPRGRASRFSARHSYGKQLIMGRVAREPFKTERRGWVGGESKGQTRIEIYSMERRGHVVQSNSRSTSSSSLVEAKGRERGGEEREEEGE